MEPCVAGQAAISALSVLQSKTQPPSFHTYGALKAILKVKRTYLMGRVSKAQSSRSIFGRPRYGNDVEGYLHFGSPVRDAIRFTIGHIPAPFGINYSAKPKHLTDQLNSLDQLRGIHRMAAFSLDNLKDTTIDLSTQIPATHHQKHDESWSTIRASHDLPLLGGIRMVGSAAIDDIHRKAYSLGVFHHDKSGSISAIEWKRGFPDQAVEGFFRTTVKSNIQNGYRYFFEYEDRFQQHWSTMLGVEHSLEAHPMLNLSGYVSHIRLRPEDIATFSGTVWAFSLTLEATF